VTLTLTITSPNGAALGAARQMTFGPEGGVIGRNEGCSWVLPDSKVSSRHAVVTYDNGVFYIEDTSTNGVYLKSSRSRLGRGRPYALRAGDCLLIDPYVIDVSISSASAGQSRPRVPAEPAVFAEPLGGADPFAPDPFFDQRAQPAMAPPQSAPAFGPVASDEVDPLKLLGGSAASVAPAAAPQRSPLNAQDLNASSPLRDFYQAPAIPPPAGRGADPRGNAFIPEDYDPLRDDASADFPPPPPAPRPRPARRREPVRLAPAPPAPDVFAPPAAAPPPPVEPVVDRALPDGLIPPPAVARAAMEAAGNVPVAPLREPSAPSRPPAPPEGSDARIDLGAVLEGAGLRPEDIPPDLARDFGRILRIVVSGLMDVLRARQDLKGEFRLRSTQFRPADNNPLKFSANVEDALHNLLVKRNPAYLAPVDAFEDAFDDLRHHQLAMLAGMRTAFERMLTEFDADRLQADFDRQVKRSALLGKPKYWDLYKEHVAALLKDPETTFRRLFGEEFAKEYEAQLLRLKSPGR
jgi:predicted component of type VI protein secretion system